MYTYIVHVIRLLLPVSRFFTRMLRKQGHPKKLLMMSWQILNQSGASTI